MSLYNIIILIIMQWTSVFRLLFILKKQRRSFRRWWVKAHIRSHMRNAFGAYENLFLYFMREDHEEFFSMTRMTPDDFEVLFNIVGPHLKKVSRREPLPPRLRLALILNYLANGDSVRTTQHLFRVGRSTIYKMVHEVCEVIFGQLSPWYLRERTTQEWRIISESFRVKWNLPHCVGALDGKEFAINKPPHSGSLYYNYKKFFSIKLLAICDAYCRFTWVDIGNYGSVSDLSAWRNTDFYKALLQDLIPLPPKRTLPRSTIVMPYFFIGDEIFTQRYSFLMSPIPRRRVLSDEQKYYNYRLSRARQTIEAAFGLLVSMWQIFQHPLRFKLETCMMVVLATICLHNFTITRKLEREEEVPLPENREEPDEEEVENEEVEEVNNIDVQHEIPQNVRQQIDFFVAYLNSDAGRLF
ncbi:uncharacterized protein LOC122512032 [Leptopilina heterotoma]|uniref:uncharacterized protein LOC122512032 n=1 Tax=Leptopilina heterotoma TaxID=63436 RepID=UPI001CA85B5F|nr:uncharacterized protein LOC122512032 [Leptopilina heterotoma]